MPTTIQLEADHRDELRARLERLHDEAEVAMREFDSRMAEAERRKAEIRRRLQRKIKQYKIRDTLIGKARRILGLD